MFSFERIGVCVSVCVCVCVAVCVLCVHACVRASASVKSFETVQRKKWTAGRVCSTL